MTYCVGVKLDEGLILASDSRTHAGVDNDATFCKMTVFDRPGNCFGSTPRVISSRPAPTPCFCRPGRPSTASRFSIWG